MSTPIQALEQWAPHNVLSAILQGSALPGTSYTVVNESISTKRYNSPIETYVNAYGSPPKGSVVQQGSPTQPTVVYFTEGSRSGNEESQIAKIFAGYPGGRNTTEIRFNRTVRYEGAVTAPGFGAPATAAPVSTRRQRRLARR